MSTTRRGQSQTAILDHIKRSGSSTIPVMADALGLSVETVRTHLKALASDGLVVRLGRQRNGPGRPEIIYGLTDAAQRTFPDRGSEVLRDFAAYLEENGHEDLVEGFFDGELSRRRATVVERVEGLGGGERLTEVVRVLNDEGFMAEVEYDDADNPVLRLCHCPMREVVSVTRAPCRAELRFVRELLGKELSRVSYIPTGDTACCYAVREAV